ncbi:MAG: hypothetical protein ACRC8A_12630 [Microcoleaceae cyanobacterium]
MIEQKFSGVIPPLRLSGNSNNQIIPLIDWSYIWNRHVKTGAINPEWQVQLEYLQCNYLIKSVARVPTSAFPQMSIRDSALQKQAKMEDYRYKFNVASGHAIQVNLHTQWGTSAWGEPCAAELLYNLGGNMGYLNFFKPYLSRDANVVFGDRLMRIGLSVTGSLTNDDFIEFSGGYSGSISYTAIAVDLVTTAGKFDVRTTAIKILNSRETRKRIYIGNAGSSPLYFRFTENIEALDTRAAPFIPSGETLTLENGKIFYSGDNSHHWLSEMAEHYIKLPLYAVRSSGSGVVVVEEHYE